MSNRRCIPVSELSDDPEYKVGENIRVGDEIDVRCARQRCRGMIMLSRRSLTASAAQDIVQEACDNRTTMEGIVTEENKGGIVVMLKGSVSLYRRPRPASERYPHDRPRQADREAPHLRSPRTPCDRQHAVHQEERRAELKSRRPSTSVPSTTASSSLTSTARLSISAVSTVWCLSRAVLAPHTPPPTSSGRRFSARLRARFR